MAMRSTAHGTIDDSGNLNDSGNRVFASARRYHTT